MEGLETLSLAANEITDFAYDTLHDLPNVKKVDLSRNNLIFLNPKLFNNMLELKTFQAHFNSLQYLDGRLFINNLKLRTVTFEYNKITVIGIDFNRLSRLEHVNLAQNICINKKFPEDPLAEVIEEIRKNCNEALELNVQRRRK